MRVQWRNSRVLEYQRMQDDGHKTFINQFGIWGVRCILIWGQVLYKDLDSAEAQMAIAAVGRLVNFSASSHVFVAPAHSHFDWTN